MTRRSRTYAAWLATLAIALQVLWPLVAQAKPANSLLVAVCSIEGTHYVELQNDTPLDKRSAAQHEHCKLCFFGGDRAILAEPVFALLGAVDPVSITLTARSAVPPAVFSAAPAHPRAPPFTS